MGLLAGWKGWPPLRPPLLLLLGFAALFMLPSLVSGTFTARSLSGSLYFITFTFVAALMGYLPTWWGLRRARDRRAHDPGT